MPDEPIEAHVVMWLGRDSAGKWWWAAVDEKFTGRTQASGYECKMDAVEGCVRAFHEAIVDRINAKGKK